jgi:hypothetical protein
VYVGNCSTDCTQLRLTESWLNGVPVVQILPSILASPSPAPLTNVEHGGSGLLARGGADLLEHVDRILDNAEYAGYLANRSKAFVMRAAPSWQDLCLKLAE